jgi:hypothetical protein
MPHFCTSGRGIEPVDNKMYHFAQWKGNAEEPTPFSVMFNTSEINNYTYYKSILKKGL